MKRKIKKVLKSIFVLVVAHFVTKLLLTLLPILGLSLLCSIIVYLFVRYLVRYFMN